MWTCKKCGVINPDSSTVCDCGKAATAGALAPVPWILWLYVAIVVGLTAANWYFTATRPPRRYGWEPTEAQYAARTARLGVITIALILLLPPLLFARRNWARLTLGVVSFPIGLMLLIPRSVRAYTGAADEAPAQTPSKTLGLR